MAKITNSPNIDLITFLSTKTARTKAEELAKKVQQVIAARRAFETLEANLKNDLKETLKPVYFSVNTDACKASEVQHTFDAGDLQVNFVNAYVIKDAQHAQTIAKLLGANHPLLKDIQESQKIVVDVSKLNSAEAIALAKAITNQSAKYGIKPEVEREAFVTDSFHNDRHIYLTVEDNKELDKTLPMQIQVASIE